MQKVKQFAIAKRDLCIRIGVTFGVLLAMVLALSLTVFAETTYSIYDGENHLVYSTDATEPADVLSEAGLPLCAGDTYTLEEGFVTATITVRRAVDVTINYYGEPITEQAYEDETLADVLKRLKLTWEEDDLLSQPLETLAYDGLNLAISNVEVKQETVTSAIAYETVHVDDDDMKKGATKVRTEGREGTLLTTSAVTFINGVETSREVISEEVAAQPVKEVVAVGTGKNVVEFPRAGVTIGKDTITLSNGKVLHYSGTKTVNASAYTHTDAGCNKTTATGTTVRWGTVAVDPRVIPYGTKMFIVSNDGSFVYGVATAEDCGGAIKDNRIDLYMPSYSQCISFGRRTCTVYFLA